MYYYDYIIAGHRTKQIAAVKSNEQLEVHNEILTEDIGRFKESIRELEAETETYRKANDAMQIHIKQMQLKFEETLQKVRFCFVRETLEKKKKIRKQHSNSFHQDNKKKKNKDKREYSSGTTNEKEKQT